MPEERADNEEFEGLRKITYVGFFSLIPMVVLYVVCSVLSGSLTVLSEELGDVEFSLIPLPVEV